MEKEIQDIIAAHKEDIQEIISPLKKESNDLGWIDLDKVADSALLKTVQEKADEIREKADVFLLIGVGGSNQGARAVIESIGDQKVEIIYTGNNLSPYYLNKIMKKIKGKSIYANVIAKNFATLEPGIVFRVIRNYMEAAYGNEEAGKRIIATGSLNGSNLEVLGMAKKYALMPFPLDVGGRYSVLSAVGLLPIAVAGVNLQELLDGAVAMKSIINTTAIEQNPVVLYAAIRNVLFQKKYGLEILAHFEPMFTYFSKWWVQLFGESEGKDYKGIYPTMRSFSEDLHSLGQYIQQGQRNIFETFLNLEEQGSYKVPHQEIDNDGFGYIDGKDFSFLNRTAYQATIEAHTSGGVPCIVLNVPEISAYYFGQLFYFFEYACYISGTILGVNPFDQPGVEAYKEKMFMELKK